MTGNIRVAPRRSVEVTSSDHVLRALWSPLAWDGEHLWVGSASDHTVQAILP